MNKKYKKIALKIFTFLNILFLLAPPTCFGIDLVDINSFSGMDLNSTIATAINQVDSHYGIDSTQIQAGMNQANVMQNKVQAPQVSLTFYPSNPLPGKKITATAQPMYFLNSPEKLYYTWFLIHKDESDNDDIETYKRRAMRIIASDGFNYEDTDYSSNSDDDGYKATEGGDDQKGRPHYCFLFNNNSGEFYPDDSVSANGGLSCEHLFPNAPGHTTGDGTFNNEEEQKWQTNPSSPDTGGYGQTDEATVSGLGRNTFSWTYQAGDRVGVAVEGVSMIPTKVADASYKIMWALSGKGCDANCVGATDDIEKTCDEDEYVQDVDDMNDHCLRRSFVDPTEKGENSKINVELDYFPEFPANNPSDLTGENSDILSISSSISGGSEKNRTFYYDWRIYEGDTMDEESDLWKIIPKDKLTGIEQTSGVGIDTLRFGLNLKSNPKYLKIKLLVSESAPSGEKNTSRGQGTVIVPMFSNEDRIRIYTASVSSDAALSKNSLRCEDPNKICQVTMDEILVAEVSANLENFYWTLNDAPLSYKYAGQNFTEPENLVYFPVLKSVGNEFILSMSASKKDSGEKVVLTKKFKVVDPSLVLVSDDVNTCAPVVKGYFISPDGTEAPDYSDKNYEALTSSTIALKAILVGPPQEINNLEWTVPEAQLTGTGKTFSFTASAEPGTGYTVSAFMTYAPSRDVQRALYDYWDVPLNRFYEKELYGQLDIETTDAINAPEGELVYGGKKPVASLFSGISAYFIFLFKLMLTTALIIFGLGILSSLASGRREVD